MQYAEGTDEFYARYHEVMPEDFIHLDVAEQRRLFERLGDAFPYDLPDGIRVEHHEITRDGRRLLFRSYRPERPRGRGFVVYFHGGGFVVGSLDSHEPIVAELADRTGLVAVSAEFPHAPEHPFPAALEDCYAILGALAEDPGLVGGDVDTAEPVLCGDSSGANLAVALCMLCRDRGGPRPKGQGLIGPVLDFARWFDGNPDVDFGEEMRHYTRSYCPTRELVEHPYASPLVHGSFHGLPPAYVMSTEYDELREDAEVYAERLRELGIPVQLVVEPGLPHAPVRGRSVIPQVADAWRRYCAAVGLLAEPVIDLRDGVLTTGGRLGSRAGTR
jgi:acetyl esterase